MYFFFFFISALTTIILKYYISPQQHNIIAKTVITERPFFWVVARCTVPVLCDGTGREASCLNLTPRPRQRFTDTVVELQVPKD